MIRGLSEQFTSENNDKPSDMVKSADETKESTTIKLGAGLLNDASKKSIKMIVEHVPRNMIEKNEKNDRSMNGIGELAWSIQHCGLKNPLHVKRTPTGFKLLGGERRLTAIDTLIADEDIEDWNEETLIPVVVQDFDAIDLPLNDEMKELFAMVTTNKEARKYTDGDKAKEIQEWKLVISALRVAGVEKLTLSKRGRKVTQQIKGLPTREILSSTTNMSRGTINAFEKVANQGSEAVNEALLSNDISVHVANQIIDSSDSKEEQDETIQKIKESGDANRVIAEVKLNKEKIKAERETLKENQKPGESEKNDFIDAKKESELSISLKKFENDIQDITELLRKRQIKLDEKEIMSYYNTIRELEKILKVN